MLSPLLLAALLQGAPATPAPTTVPSPAAGTGAQAALPPGTIAIAQMRIEAAMAKLGVPGLAVAVVAREQLVWSAAFGEADVENEVPVRTDTMFRLARQVSPDGLTYTFARDKLPALFYADVSPEDRYKAMERLRPQPLSISTTPVTLTEDRFGSVPRWYIECTHDNAVRIKLQRQMVKMTPCKTITMECGHSPYFSNPEELVEHLEAIAKS